MSEEFKEYTLFKVTASDGNEVEMAVIEEFEYDHKTYVAAAVVENDTINEDGLYIYEAKVEDEELVVKKITDKDLYAAVTKAYLEIE